MATGGFFARIFANFSFINILYILIFSRFVLQLVVVVTLPATIREQLLLSKYDEMVQNLHTEPKQEAVISSFLSKAETLNIDETTNLNERNRKKKNMNKNSNEVKCKDIRVMLKKFN